MALTDHVLHQHLAFLLSPTPDRTFCLQMLNCILSMVEKTKRALTILQQRPSEAADGAPWGRAGDAADIKRQASEIMAQTVKATEERVAEVRRRAGTCRHVPARREVCQSAAVGSGIDG